MPVLGDFAQLAMLRSRLKQLAEGGAQKVLLPAMRDEVHRQVLDCFNEKRDPYGRRWVPRKPPAAWAAKAFGMMQQNHPLLDKTGALINSVQVKATSTGVMVTMLGYGVYHWQPEGRGNKLPQRSMLPTARQGLGPIWGNAFLRVSHATARGYFGVI